MNSKRRWHERFMIWLEGEDGNCWNDNAGQDWNIALKFSKDPLEVAP